MHGLLPPCFSLPCNHLTKHLSFLLEHSGPNPNLHGQKFPYSQRYDLLLLSRIPFCLLYQLSSVHCRLTVLLSRLCGILDNRFCNPYPLKHRQLLLKRWQHEVYLRLSPLQYHSPSPLSVFRSVLTGYPAFLQQL